MQKDFIDGALGTKEAVAIVPAVVAKIQEFKQKGNPIIFTKDTHFENYMETQEGRNLPVMHCIKGTEGFEICDEIKAVVDLEKSKVYEKVTFGSSEFAKDLAQGVYSDVEAITLIGLCTDLCDLQCHAL